MSKVNETDKLSRVKSPQELPRSLYLMDMACLNLQITITPLSNDSSCGGQKLHNLRYTKYNRFPRLIPKIHNINIHYLYCTYLFISLLEIF